VSIGFSGNKSASDGIKGIVGTLIGTAEDLIEKVQFIVRFLPSLTWELQAGKIGEMLKSMEPTQDSGAEVSNMEEQMKGYLGQAKDVQGQIEKYDGYRFQALMVSFIAPLVLVVIGAIGALFNWKWLAIM
jgi:hypothetical protein